MPFERRESINTYIQSRGEVHLNELEELYPNVSSMTIRRDLEQLEQQGEIVRIRGGAKSIAHLSMLKEAAYTQRIGENIEGKKIIAQKALSYVTPGRSFFIDSGTTSMFFAQKFPDENFFVLTTSPNVALELLKLPGVRVNLTGGQLNRETLSLSGHNALNSIEDINIDIAFMASSAFSLNAGFTCGDYSEAEIKKSVIKKANKVIMLMDGSKCDHEMPYTFAGLSDIDIFITDRKLQDEIEEAISRTNVVLL